MNITKKKKKKFLHNVTILKHILHLEAFNVIFKLLLESCNIKLYQIVIIELPQSYQEIALDYSSCCQIPTT
jgi:hypothetical protein